MQCRQNSNIEILKLDFSVKVNMKSFSKIKRTFVKPKFSWFRAAILPIFPNTYYKNESWNYNFLHCKFDEKNWYVIFIHECNRQLHFEKMGESTFQDIILVWFVKRILKQIWHKNKKFCSSFFYILEIFILNINEVYYYQSNSSLDLSLYIWTFLNAKTFLTH